MLINHNAQRLFLARPARHPLRVCSVSPPCLLRVSSVILRSLYGVDVVYICLCGGRDCVLNQPDVWLGALDMQ